jgi:cell division protein FtsB
MVLGWLPNQIYGHGGLGRLYKLRGELTALRQENAERRAENARLRAELALDEDDELAAVERIARDELGLVKTGEIVFKLADGRREAEERPRHVVPIPPPRTADAADDGEGDPAAAPAHAQRPARGSRAHARGHHR